MSFTQTANIEQLDGSHVNMTDRTRTRLCRRLPICDSLISKGRLQSRAVGVPGPPVNSCAALSMHSKDHFCLTLAMVETELRNSLPGQSRLALANSALDTFGSISTSSKPILDILVRLAGAMRPAAEDGDTRSVHFLHNGSALGAT